MPVSKRLWKWLLLGFVEEIICPQNAKDAYFDVCANEMVLYNFTQKKQLSLQTYFEK